jgi:hypothetical protein
MDAASTFVTLCSRADGPGRPSWTIAFIVESSFPALRWTSYPRPSETSGPHAISPNSSMNRFEGNALTMIMSLSMRILLYDQLTSSGLTSGLASAYLAALRCEALVQTFGGTLSLAAAQAFIMCTT